MRCKSCKEEVPSKFTHAISVNVCPLCGSEIMPSKLQKLLNDLKATMEEAKEFNEEIADWMFSNYGLKKFEPNVNLPPQSTIIEPVVKSTPAPIRRTEEVQTEAGEMMVQSPFAIRAGVKALTYSDMVKKIQGGAGAADPSEFVGQDDEYGNIDDIVSEAPLDVKGQKEIMSIFNNNDSDALELEKLKKMRSQSSFSNGGGKFRRT